MEEGRKRGRGGREIKGGERELGRERGVREREGGRERERQDTEKGENISKQTFLLPINYFLICYHNINMCFDLLNTVLKQ